MLVDAVSRLPNAKDGAAVNDIEVPVFSYEGYLTGYEDDKFYEPFFKVLTGQWPEDPKQNNKLDEVLPSFKMK